MSYRVVIHYSNGSTSERAFPNYSEAQHFCRDNISYSGGRVRRVEIHEGTSVRAMWDADWTAESRYAGLYR